VGFITNQQDTIHADVVLQGTDVEYRFFTTPSLLECQLDFCTPFVRNRADSGRGPSVLKLFKNKH
jgi:hypothetical protein